MITEEERQSIINEAVEKALLALPEVVGNLMANQASLMKMNREFYKKYPEFSTEKDLVASVVEKVDSDNPGIGYEKILERSVPLIRERLRIVKSLDFKSVERPSRDLSTIDLSHGEL